jgi:hypothetical protein
MMVKALPGPNGGGSSGAEWLPSCPSVVSLPSSPSVLELADDVSSGVSSDVDSSRGEPVPLPTGLVPGAVVPGADMAAVSAESWTKETRKYTAGIRKEMHGL